MKKHFRRILSVVLTLALILCISQTAAFATTGLPDTRSATTYEKDFPLNLTPIVDPDSVRYIPVTGEDQASTILPTGTNMIAQIDGLLTRDMELDQEMLSVGLAISLKEEFSEYESFELSVSTDEGLILHETYSFSETTIIPKISSRLHQFYVCLSNSEQILEFFGNFSYDVNESNEVFLSMDYETTRTSLTSVQAIPQYNETESNNSFTTANQFYWGRTINGTLSSSSDADYFKAVNNNTLPNGTSKIYRWIRVAAKSNCTDTQSTYAIRIYHQPTGSSTRTLVSTMLVWGQGSKMFSVPIVSYGAGTYYICVSPQSNTSSFSNSSYTLFATLSDASSWYSQLSGYDCTNYGPSSTGVIHYWNTEKIDSLTCTKFQYSSSEQISAVFVGNNTGSNRKGSVMRTGCYIACAAMLLRNKNYSSSKTMYDFRTGIRGNLDADPFTVFLANNNMNGELGSNFTTSSITRSVNVSFTPANINSYFGCNLAYENVANNLNGRSRTDYFRNILYYHSEGFIAIYSDGHAVVVSDYVGPTGIISNDSAINTSFTVCDPFTVTANKGCNVLQSNSAYSSQSLVNVKNIIYFK